MSKRNDLETALELAEARIKTLEDEVERARHGEASVRNRIEAALLVQCGKYEDYDEHAHDQLRSIARIIGVYERLYGEVPPAPSTAVVPERELSSFRGKSLPAHLRAQTASYGYWIRLACQNHLVNGKQGNYVSGWVSDGQTSEVLTKFLAEHASHADNLTPAINVIKELKAVHGFERDEEVALQQGGSPCRHCGLQEDDNIHTFSYSQTPHKYAGSNPERQMVGDPGHCEACCSIGHVAAHPDLGCGDVGCYATHGEPDPNAYTLKVPELVRAELSVGSTTGDAWVILSCHNAVHQTVAAEIYALSSRRYVEQFIKNHTHNPMREFETTFAKTGIRVKPGTIVADRQKKITAAELEHLRATESKIKEILNVWRQDGLSDDRLEEIVKVIYRRPGSKV